MTLWCVGTSWMWYTPWCQETEPGTCPGSSGICRWCSGGSLTTECLCPETHNSVPSHSHVRRLNIVTSTHSRLSSSRYNTVIPASTINKRLLDVYRSDLTLVTMSSNCRAAVCALPPSYCPSPSRSSPSGGKERGEQPRRRERVRGKKDGSEWCWHEKNYTSASFIYENITFKMHKSRFMSSTPAEEISRHSFVGKHKDRWSKRTVSRLTSASVSISSLPNQSGSYMSARQSWSRRDASCIAESKQNDTASRHRDRLVKTWWHVNETAHTHFSRPSGTPSGPSAVWCLQPDRNNTRPDALISCIDQILV